MDYHRLPWIIMDYQGLSWFIADYDGFSGTIMDYRGLAWTIMDNQWIAVDYHELSRLSWIIMNNNECLIPDYCGVSWISIRHHIWISMN